MNPAKWQKINDLFHAALEVEEENRLQFIETASGADIEISAEVKKLVSAHARAENFIQKPAAENALEILSDQTDTAMLKAEKDASEYFTVGRKIGRFEIVGLIGKGGMGEVFLARDKSLERDVAIKILRPEFTADADRLKRFQLEAKSVSALNHPNILTIHEIGESAELRFIATEYVKGQTLTEYLQREKPALKTKLKIALQIASALQAAHETGIVHRDIKPDNVMIRQDGLVKVLDFGLAKLVEREQEKEKSVSKSSGRPVSPPSNLSTTPGMIMGTPQYMSPEQARGRAIDAQTDIFSFGVVLYEMLGGQTPFAGDTMSDTIAAILTKEPLSLSELNPEISPELENIVNKTLQKDKQTRYQTAKSLFTDLTELTEDLQAQDRLERSLVPNKNEARTQVLRATTIEQGEKTVVDETSETRSKSFKTYLIAGFAAVLLTVALLFGYQNLFPPKQIESIAVLPFVNDSGNSEMEYLSDGMTETLIKRLSNIPNLSVKARSSVFRYKGRETDLKKIASELKVQAIITGRITQKGDEITLSLDLVEAETEKNLWNERYVRKQSDLVSLQNEIAKDVSTNLKTKLSGEETAKIVNSGTTNPEAFQLYLKGLYFLNNGTIEKKPENVRFFEKAVEIDPNFALGYVGIADSYTLLGTILKARMTSAEAMPKAKAAAEKAIELNPNLSEAYTSLAWIKFRFDWDWDGAEKNFKKAIELNPVNSQAHHWYAEYLHTMRRYEEAVKELKIARDLEPFSGLIQSNVGIKLFFTGRYDEAVAEIEKGLELDKNNWRPYFFLVRSYAKKGMPDKAFEVLLKEAETIKNLPNERIALLKEAFRQNGIEGALRKRSEFDLEDADKDNATFYNRGINYLRLRDIEKALDMFEKAYVERNGSMVLINADPENIEPLKNEPRFREIIRKMNFPQ